MAWNCTTPKQQLMRVFSHPMSEVEINLEIQIVLGGGSPSFVPPSSRLTWGGGGGGGGGESGQLRHVSVPEWNAITLVIHAQVMTDIMQQTWTNFS